LTSLKRLCITFVVVVGLCLVGTAQVQAKQYSLASGSGAQLHIGNGLALPVQTAVPALPGGNAFPPLGIPAVPGAVVSGTVANSSNQQLTIPANVLSRPATQGTVGVFFSNNKLYAVGSSLNFQWPAAAIVLNATNAARSAGQVLKQFGPTSGGNAIKYKERVPGKRFGGAGQFVLSPGANSATSGVLNAAVTVYGLFPAAPTPPPCTHTALTPVPFPGPGAAGCLAGMLAAAPTGVAAAGGAWANTVATLGLAANIKAGVGKFGPGILKPGGPLGTVSVWANAGAGAGTAINAASSTGFPFTTAIVSITAAAASPAEQFIISGNDTRTAGGQGTIQMVAGAVSNRSISGPNANRAWLRLNLVEPTNTPAMSPPVRLVTVALIALLAVGYFVVRPRVASNA
jgi:hypothetical protein